MSIRLPCRSERLAFEFHHRWCALKLPARIVLSGRVRFFKTLSKVYGNSFTSSPVPLQSIWTRILHSSSCTTFPHPILLSTSAENSPHSTLGLSSHINPDGSAQRKSDKGSVLPLSSSPLLAPRHRTLLCYHACQPFPLTTDLRDAFVSTPLPNA